MQFGGRRSAVWAEVAIFVAIAAFVCAVRLVLLEPMEIGSDAYQRWHFARQWFHDLELREVTWDHHKSRLGVIFPMVIGQALFGRGPLVYSGVAIACAAGAALTLYALGRAVHGRLVGVAAVAIWVLSPDMIRSGSQVTPEAWVGLYAALSLLALLRAQGKSERFRIAGVAIASALLFLAYLAKETAVIFVPGALAACWFLSRRARDVLVFAGVQALLLLAESGFYALVSPYSSRAELIQSSLASSEGAPAYIEGFSGFFLRYATLPSSYRLLLAAAGAAALALPFLTRDRRVRAVIAYPASFYFFSTFLLKGLDPLEVWVRFLPRYLDAGATFAALLTTLGLAHAAAALERAARSPEAPARLRIWLRATRERRTRLGSMVSRTLPLWAPLLLAAAAWNVHRRHPPGENHPLRTMPRAARILNDTYRRGLPTRAVGEKKYRWKLIGAALCAYIDDELLLENGKLPEFDQLVSKEREGIVRGERRRVPKRCEVRLFTEDGLFAHEPLDLLPPECDEFRAQ